MPYTRTSLNTKRMLADSLKKALRTKPFSKVTVSEIVADCGVNRKTFYYHFEDIFALLKWTIEEDMAEILITRKCVLCTYHWDRLKSWIPS